MLSKRFLMVLVLSSAAKIPLFFATMRARRWRLSSAVFISGRVSLLSTGAGQRKDNKIQAESAPRVDLQFK